MALTQAQGTKLFEIYRAIDEMDTGIESMDTSYRVEREAAMLSHRNTIKALVIAFKQMGGANADLPQRVKLEMALQNGGG